MANRKSLTVFGTLALTLTLIAGCASHNAYLVPAPTDKLTGGGHAVMASTAGVTITVTPNAWNGTPANLNSRITPLKVRIDNNSQKPIRLAYDDFTLQTPNQTLAALPPSAIADPPTVGELRTQGVARTTLVAWDDGDRSVDRAPVRSLHFRGRRIRPEFDWDDFYFAPYWGYGYLGIGAWPYYWAPDVRYYSRYYPYMRAFHLPTRSMLRKGLPEGVIAPGGYVSGFLYFGKVSPKANQVRFVAKLRGADTGQQFGTIQIPFNVERTSVY